MKRYLVVGVICVVLLALVRHFYFIHEENEKMDAFIDSRLSENLQVSLDCPPLGQQKITFLTDKSTPELTSENMSLIVKQWSEFWPSTYKALEQAAKDYNGGDKFTGDPEIRVVLPGANLSSNPSWTIEYSSKGGEYAAQMTGMTVKSAKDDY